MDYLIFRSRALQGLSLIPRKQDKVMSKDEIEQWIKGEYERHYPKRSDQNV